MTPRTPTSSVGMIAHAKTNWRLSLGAAHHCSIWSSPAPPRSSSADTRIGVDLPILPFTSHHEGFYHSGVFQRPAAAKTTACTPYSGWLVTAPAKLSESCARMSERKITECNPSIGDRGLYGNLHYPAMLDTIRGLGAVTTLPITLPCSSRPAPITLSSVEGGTDY